MRTFRLSGGGRDPKCADKRNMTVIPNPNTGSMDAGRMEFTVYTNT